MEKLTEEVFWEAYWDGLRLPVKPNLRFSNDRAIASVLLRHLRRDSLKEAFEVGCAPGKWLVFLHEQFNFMVSGCEYLPAAAEATMKNLEMTGTPYCEILCQDALTMVSTKKYDVVISLGFIEHFTDPAHIIKKHVDLLKPGGILIIGVPNFRGIGHFFQSRIDKRLVRDKILPSHNLSVMRKQFFSAMVSQLQMKRIFLGYVGGFDRALFKSQLLGIGGRITFRLTNAIFGNALAKKVSMGFYSSYLIGVFRSQNSGVPDEP